MNENEKTPDNAQFQEWIKNHLGAWEQLWLQSSQAWQAPFGAVPENAGEPGRQPGPDEIGKGLFEFFQALSSIAGTPKPGDFQSAKSVPDMMLKMLQPFWGYSIKLQKQWAEMTGATATGEPENMAELVKQMTKSFYDAQGEDFRKILNVPQLGLNRYYQERQNKAIEKASEFQSALTEFLQLLIDSPVGKGPLRRPGRDRQAGEGGKGGNQGLPGPLPALDPEARRSLHGAPAVRRVHEHAPGNAQ